MRRILHLITGGCIGGSNQRQPPAEQTPRSHRPGKAPMGTGTSTEEVHRLHNRSSFDPAESGDSKDSFLVYQEAKLPARREELAAVDGDFDSILAGLKSECNLFSDLDELKEQCPLAERSGEETALLADDTRGEGEGEGEDDVPASGDV
ncbi:hypothetical protein F2Q69_00029036 [Brassica cretica]|uniref:Uncharacterized protein n=1 Tax=Brassica cretica TaxID=69181 RepID=A0A8S9RVJ0_BRACR|nr:hypothetical protein F2Q69_00029036 [Brassica cretica]